MGDNTHTLAVHRVNDIADSAKVHVPASEQREQGICIDDDVEVTVHDANDYVDSASFEAPQIAGDSVTVPADFVRSVGLELGEQYPVSFEKIAEEEEIEESGELDDDVEETAEKILEEMKSDFELEEEEAETEEAEDKGLGELFG